MEQINWYKIFYLLTVADGIKSLSGTIALLFSILAVITCGGMVITFCMSMWGDWDDDDRKLVNYWKRCFIVIWSISSFFSIIGWSANVLIPSRTDALIIIAGGTIGNFITSDSSAKAIPYELTLLVREKLKSEITQLKTADFINSQVIDTLSGKSKEELIKIIKNK